MLFLCLITTFILNHRRQVGNRHMNKSTVFYLSLGKNTMVFYKICIIVLNHNINISNPSLPQYLCPDTLIVSH